MTILSLERSVLERLSQCAVEIGMASAWDVPPKRRIQKEDMPCAYGLVSSTYAYVTRSTGQVLIPRTYIQRVVISSFDGSPDKVIQGNEALNLAHEWTTVFHKFYHEHPQLSTSTLPSLAGCKMIERTSDSGVVFRKVPGGAWALAIDLSLDILMSVNADIVISPYGT